MFMVIIDLQNIVNTFINVVLLEIFFLVPQIEFKSTHNDFNVMCM